MKAPDIRWSSRPLGRPVRGSLLLALVALAAVVTGFVMTPPSISLADDTGLLSPTAYTTGTSGNPCSYPEKALLEDVSTGFTDDAKIAKCRTDNPPTHVTDTQTYHDFNASIPANDTIDGVEVVISGYRTGPNALTGLRFRARLSRDSGVNWSGYQEIANDLTTVDALYTLGGPSDLWGLSNWSAAHFTNANFRLEIEPIGPAATGEHWKLDSVRLRVYHTAPPPRKAAASASGRTTRISTTPRAGRQPATRPPPR